MKSCRWSAEPVSSGGSAKPDFLITSPTRYFCEVTTLNVSREDQETWSCGEGVLLNHEQTIKRILQKITSEKSTQIEYGAAQATATVLVLFDYTTWSALAWEFSQALADYLLYSQVGFKALPLGLSAIVYVEKKIFGGRFAFSKLRSAVYHNPCAICKLPITRFTMFLQYVFHKPPIPAHHSISSDWIWLS